MGGKSTLQRLELPKFALSALTAAILLAPSVRAWDDPSHQDGAVLRDGPRLRIGQILLAGNETLPPRAILQHVPLRPGVLFGAEDLRDTERLLAKLALFEVGSVDEPSPSVTIVERGDKSEYKDILIRVREKPDARRRWRLMTALRVAATACAYGLPAGLAEALAE